MPEVTARGVLSYPLRLLPGDDLREALLTFLRNSPYRAAFVAAGIGSLSRIALRRAGSAHAESREAVYELLTLSGTLAVDGAHLHATVADALGAVSGGHVGTGCIVRTTMEVLVLALPDMVFARVADPATGFRELAIMVRGDQ
jgi:predicted DNA-binding protein with PD1-like motif